MPLIQSSGRPGFDRFVLDDPLHVHARKLAREVTVEFAPAACKVATREGEVWARAGDAIITGVGGERWRVTRSHFAAKYEPVAPTRAGEGGRYRSLRYGVLALPMDEGFEVLLADGRSRLRGRPGDWLVDYGDGSLGIVSPAIFASTYDISPPVERPARSSWALHQIIQSLLLLGVARPRIAEPRRCEPPALLAPLFVRMAPTHNRFDETALVYGHRYRSGFWAIYLLSAIAVLCAVVPLALGWDSETHAMHPYAGAWALAELAIIVAVSLIYWRGSRSDWHGQWLGARTTAELTAYLPLLAPLVDLSDGASEQNWYLRAFDPSPHLSAATEVGDLCRRVEPLARTVLAGAWSDPLFVQGYAAWAAYVLQRQRHYHERVAFRHHALLHRVHRVNGALFALTALGAATHLFVHTLWLTLLTTFFPALGASLHGALAQSESYRLGGASERLAADLEIFVRRLTAFTGAAPGETDVEGLRATTLAAIGRIIEEHQDWHKLVRPHELPLG